MMEKEIKILWKDEKSFFSRKRWNDEGRNKSIKEESFEHFTKRILEILTKMNGIQRYA